MRIMDLTLELKADKAKHCAIGFMSSLYKPSKYIFKINFIDFIDSTFGIQNFYVGNVYVCDYCSVLYNVVIHSSDWLAGSE